MKHIHKLLRAGSKSPSVTGSALSAPPSTALSHMPPGPFLTTLNRPVSPLTSSAPLAEELWSSPGQTARTNLKEVFKAVRDASDLYPPFKTALSAVISIMDSIDITDWAGGLTGIFSQYGSEQDISPSMRGSLDAVISELKSIEEAIGSKTKGGRARHTLKAPGDVDKVAIAFKRLGIVIDRFQLNMGLRTSNYYMDVHGGKGGAGGMAKGGTGGNGGVGQGPNFNIQDATVNILSIGSAAVPDALEKLGCVDAADIDAQSPEGCLKGTRVDLLANLRAWSRDPNSPPIFWLDGMAGTGKSAITRSFCRMLREDKQLGGSFFCLRGDANRANTKHILTTLAVHLAFQDPAYKWALLAALDRGISWNANLQIQAENLLQKPLQSDHSGGAPTLVLVIDALDELDDEDAVKDLLRRLVAVVPSLPIKLFVTSRPERHIRPQFDNPADFQRVLRLHDIEENIITADISLYLTTRLAGNSRGPPADSDQHQG
ncbi:hypothetical protein B0H11DRAFT_1934422 [Mycena galericulata]|nr:hypothetical protein B0H11DRAFT_1934422 [Mycena galericulata]